MLPAVAELVEHTPQGHSTPEGLCSHRPPRYRSPTFSTGKNSCRSPAKVVDAEQVRPESITAAVVLREKAVAPPALRRRGLCMIGAVTASVRRAVKVPGPWTPGRRRADSEGRRDGRPQALGSLAGDRRCRPCLRSGRETPTLPQRIGILAMINPEDEGVTSQPEYTLSKPSNCPNNRDHFKCKTQHAVLDCPLLFLVSIRSHLVF